MPTRTTIFALFLVGCGGSSFRVPAPTSARRDIGDIEVGALRFHVSATKRVVARDPCEPSFLRTRMCTDADVWTALDITRDGVPVEATAWDPGWEARDRFMIGERDTRSFERIDREADEMLESLTMRSCTDGRRVAYRVDSPHAAHEIAWRTLSIVQGVVFGFHGSTTAPTCEAALAELAVRERQIDSPTPAGLRRVFDAFVRGRGTVEALAFSLEHPFEIDALREPLPTIDEAFFAQLAEKAASDDAFASLVIERLSAPGSTYPEGVRGGSSLSRWVRRIVRALPEQARIALHDALAAACTAGTCAPWQLGALLEASMSLPEARRCAANAPVVDRVFTVPADAREEQLVALAESLASCALGTEVATRVVASPGSFIALDATFIYPPCIDAIGTGRVPTRCASAPTFAVLVAKDPCDAALLRAADAAAASDARPWQVAAMGVYARCGRTDALRTLVDRLRPTPAYREDGIRRALDHTFAPE